MAQRKVRGEIETPAPFQQQHAEPRFRQRHGGEPTARTGAGNDHIELLGGHQIMEAGGAW